MALSIDMTSQRLELADARYSLVGDAILAEIARIQAKRLVGSAVGALEGGGLLSMLKYAGSSTNPSAANYENSFDRQNYSGSSAGSALSLISTFASLFGRADGGPVSAGSMYRVNERGPELLQVAGKQYLMMGSQSGNVVPNDKIGAGRSGGTTIINQTQGRIDRVTESYSGDERVLLIEQAADHVAKQLSDPNSRVSKSFGRNFKAERRR